ncbi:oligoendopeptidase F [Staphylococcus sp. SQ8-PEA]|uniref:Oligopeptidase F n=1 Tax=Staphylococcus marylandisciuri TaxID=2981529 RepID=A0ABT2QNL4_9STAP|nr:oligoendopeptidase F [Staphylococcus marylandisciuri]MCU5745557.1 oligoendopeptidase F [Staphylococcus marylandisciuri]
MQTSLPLREHVNDEEKWDISEVFSTDEEFYETINETIKAVHTFENKFKGTLNNAEQVMKIMPEYSQLLINLDRLVNYAELRLSVDATDEAAQTLNAKLNTSIGKITSPLTFVEAEMSNLSIETIEELIKTSDYPHYFTKIKNRKRHQLEPVAEEVLAHFRPTFESPFDLYGTTKMLDISFESFEHHGHKIPMDYATFENEYEGHPEPEFRRKSFKHFSQGLRKYQHTTAATYNMHVQQQKIEATLRGYDSVIDYLLEEQEVTREMYDRQIDVIMSDLAPIMQKYARLIKEIHQLDELRFEDLKVSVDPEYEPEISIESSKDYIYGALKVLGTDYVDMLETAYRNRWIDFAQNKGKETGAYCASPYVTHSYVFISWTGKMAETFVLAHELGHAGHFKLSQDNQPYLESEPSLYFVEAPSTMNEMLMANYLLDQSKDPQFQRWVIGSMIARTYYHNMVIHLLEAAYQREVYKKVDNGDSLNATSLNAITRNIYEQFYGDSVKLTEGTELTWMRQPHYYMGLYSYTYSAGLTIGTIMSQRIRHEGVPAINDWLETLKAGGSRSPKGLAQLSGIDITTDQPLKETIRYIGKLVDQLESLSQELGTID